MHGLIQRRRTASVGYSFLRRGHVRGCPKGVQHGGVDEEINSPRLLVFDGDRAPRVREPRLIALAVSLGVML